ncbi:hypothetical protein ABZX85_35940 [Streptomyces sp. NPDC004539]|uniref:hypothetical protein n=1 Tax=Streptomyces sp. NPDC004539 TaxID=3154280 RepID=UPI0033A7A120
MTYSHQVPADVAYAGAPSIVQEICLIAETSGDGPSDVSADREFRLRKAALLDRIALRERARSGGEAAADADDAALVAAEWLIEHDVAHRNLSRRGQDLVLAEDYREYVRSAYRVWVSSQTA